MRIISHRGFWLTPEEKNARTAFDRTLAAGFGTETDVRDCGGKLVVSHDPPAGTEMPWDAVVRAFDGTGLPLAVNVKADGLAPLLATAFDGRAIDWFAFDMSGPEMVRFRRAGLPYYTRHSDVEPDPILYAEADGVWLDAFETQWFDDTTITAHLARGKAVCIVSPELHGRDPAPLWRALARLSGTPGVTLCTDQPDQARQVFEQ
ncbi:phosphodiesterase [Methylobacterium sp. J-068]|uniref:phosphodiesterase n=1 Tax=Methylobacterium sp. J-068 TaxID=2836649 RepID=UPI001FB9E3B9|nr:phosphodiesterase [Methylobacterium sp. J-068]MCJ2033220.1 phosphodiesterase [Methylobacterium sp. J-068]